jgi:hypothetical protein
MKRIGLVMGLVVVGFACAEGVGSMLEDAGQILQDGSVPDAGAQTLAQCDQTHTVTRPDNSRTERRYAVVTVGNPRNAIVEQCWSESPWEFLPLNVRCVATQSTYFDGNDVYIPCGTKSYDAEGALVGESPDQASITVYE